MNYFDFLEGLVCDKALPATDFDLALVLLSRKMLDALEATTREVCFLLVAILLHHLSFYLS